MTEKRTNTDKESAYLLQKVDCNCNNCGFMVRDFEGFEASKVQREKWQRQTFERTRNARIRDAEAFKEGAYAGRMSWEKSINMHKIIAAMKYEFNNDSKLNFGNCSKLDKPVSFIPNVCQLETQECFVNRKDMKS